MKHAALVVVMLVSTFNVEGQNLQADVQRWQQHYMAEFLSDPRSPVKAKDTAYLRFFQPNASWRVSAAVTLTPDALPFDMATHSGKTKRFRQYAQLLFKPVGGNRSLVLSAYERVDRPATDTLSGGTLFIPFQDFTNGQESYGGGRYMDLMKAEVNTGKIIVDFNKAYNPYCAFGEGFSCPIPPAENRLKVAIKAGEKLPVPPLLHNE